jgi:tRNA modification GTPase
VLNKIDTHPKPDQLPTDIVKVSVKQSTGLQELRQAIITHTHTQHIDASVFSARRRHLQALQQTNSFVTQALENSIQGLELELVAEELRHAQNALSEITGRFVSDDLLGEIFGEFCIGK